MTQAPMHAEPARTSWWGRNWKWVVPVGCLAPIIVCCGGIGLIFAVVFGAIKNSDVYTQSLEAARQNPQVQAALGTPIEPKFMVSGNVNVQNATGDANITYDIAGPKGTATVNAVATLAGGQWTFTSLSASLPDGTTVDLQASPGTSPPPVEAP